MSAEDRVSQSSLMSQLSQEQCDDVNTISRFIAHTFIQPLHSPDTIYVLIGNAILHTVRTSLDYLSTLPDPITLVLCGGIGHSTKLLYNAVSDHRDYQSIQQDVKGLAEARVFEIILKQFWPELHNRLVNGRNGSRLLIEDKSTNCGLNASYTLELLRESNVKLDRLVMAQDPTMARRTMAGFEKGLRNHSCEIINWSTFVPLIQPPRAGEDWFDWAMSGGMGYEGGDNQLWGKKRFLELVMGEVPRFETYGPEETGSIVHVIIPDEVKEAYRRLKSSLDIHR